MLILLGMTALAALLSAMWTETAYSRELKDEAENGDMESQYHLAICYQSGSGIKKDEKQAALWFMRAAAQGHAEAKAILEMMKLYTGDSSLIHEVSVPDKAAFRTPSTDNLTEIT